MSTNIWAHYVIRYITAGCQVQLSLKKQKKLKKTNPAVRASRIDAACVTPTGVKAKKKKKKNKKKKNKKKGKKSPRTPHKKYLDKGTTSATPSEAVSDEDSR